jgi:hypothetical protein
LKRLTIVAAALALAGTAYFAFAGVPLRIVWQAQKTAAANLKDPGSALFSNVRYNDLKIGICGEMNAKNGYGAYGGFAGIYYDPERGIVLYEDGAVKIDPSTLGC